MAGWCRDAATGFPGHARAMSSEPGHGQAVDSVLESSAEGLRTLWISLAGLAATALAQAVVVALSGSVALVADGLHARTDGFTSLAVLIGAGGVALGWRWADPVIGLAITLAILAV